MSSEQEELFEPVTTSSLLSALIERSKLYSTTKAYRELLDFTVRLRNFAPFNAMLLQVQKPGLTYAASDRDWQERFQRQVKRKARPLLIMWPFGPVALVYDLLDTTGQKLPDDVTSFPVEGSTSDVFLSTVLAMLPPKNISVRPFDGGDAQAGSIEVTSRGQDRASPSKYLVHLNGNHSAAVRFGTVAHELAHLYLGHLGADSVLKCPARGGLDFDQRELEAESVAYIVCWRQGIRPKSEKYLSRHVKRNTTLESVDIFQVMRAAGQVEALLGLARRGRF